MKIFQDLTLGQYFPGNSFLHSLDPRSKLISLVILIITIFNADNIEALLILAVLVFILSKLSSFSLSFLARGVGLFFWFFAFTSIFHVFFTPGDSIHPFPLWGFDITYQGISRGRDVFLQLFMVIFISNIFTLTTEPMDLAKGLEKMFSPLKKVGVKTDEIALMVSLAIRFIPILKAESQKVLDAQRGRGVDFRQMTLIRRSRNLIALLGPLFTNIFSRSDTIVLAMVSRGFGMGIERGMLRELYLGRKDFISMAAVLLFSITIALIY